MSPIAEVGTAFVTLAPSARGFGAATERQVGGEMGKSGKSIGSKLGSAIKVGALAAVGGALLVGKFLKGAVDEAREAAVITARTENVIKRMGNASNISAKQVADLAGAISAKTGIDDEAIQSGQNLLLTFGNIRNEAGKGNDIFNQATKLMVDMSAAMGTDAKGSAIQLGKALNDPTKGLTALSRVGVSFTAQQEKQIKKLDEAGKTMEAQKIILGELSRQFGGAAAAMATPADKVAVAWGNVKEQIGTALLPILDRFLNFVLKTVIPGVERLAAGFSRNVGPAVATAVNFFRTKLLPVLQTVGRWVMSELVPAFQRMARDVLPDVKRTAGQAGQAFNDAKPFFRLVGDLVVQVLIPNLGKLAKVVLPALGRQLQTTGKVLGAVGRSGRDLWNKFLQPTFKFLAEAVARTLKMWGEMFQLIGKAPGFGWAKRLGNDLVDAANDAHELSQSIKDIPESKTVNLNVNEHWVTTRTVRRGSGFGADVGLASGGIVTRPTLALVGEGRESEAVMPLSKLSAMLDRERAATLASSRSAGNVFHLYDSDGTLMGTMRGVVRGDRDNTAMRRRAGATA